MIDKIWQNLDRKQNKQQIFLVFLFFWFVMNVLQAAFTTLAHDEAYYWMYSRNLAWGYFDHPPMIAILVRLGYLIFPNELGVRLLPTLMGAGTMYVIFLLVKDGLRKISVLIILLCSVVILQTHVGGFLAIPDLPLVFYGALFFLFYKKYLTNDKVYWAVLLGVVASAMMYSKYHTVLVLFFTLLSNLKLLKRWTFWVIPIIIAGAMVPHLMWQINNDFPTFGYHLVGRSSASYNVLETLNYIAGQFLVWGPFVSIWVVYHSFKAKTHGDLFLKSMKFNAVGFLVFFFFSSFKGHVEPHWTALAAIPIVILSYKSILESGKAKLWLKRLFLPSVMALVIMRFLIAFGATPSKIYFGREFKDYKGWAHQINELADGRKVAFLNSFQYPSKYAFYSGDFVQGFNSIHYRKNQYDLWRFEEELQGEDVLFFRGRGCRDTLISPAGNFAYRFIDNFRSYYDIKIRADKDIINASVNDTVTLTIEIENTRKDRLVFCSSDSLYKPQICVSWHNGKRYFNTDYACTLNDTLAVGEIIHKTVELAMPEDKGEYSINISIVNDSLLAPFNSLPVEVIVK